MKNYLSVLGFVLSPLVAFSHDTIPAISVDSSEVKQAAQVLSLEERYQNNPKHAWQMIEVSINELDQALKKPQEFTYVKRKVVYQTRNQLYKEMKSIMSAIVEKYKNQPLVVSHLLENQSAWAYFLETTLKLDYPSMPYGAFEEDTKLFRRSLQEISKRIDTLLPFLLGTHPKYTLDEKIEAI